MLQKSKVAAPRIFRENNKREAIADSYTLNRAAEVASEFDARGSFPSRLYTKDAPTAREIFGHLCKTSFATVSANNCRAQVQQKPYSITSSAVAGSISGTVRPYALAVLSLIISSNLVD